MHADPVDPEVRARAIAAAQGDAPFDLLFTGGTVVDVVDRRAAPRRRRRRRPARSPACTPPAARTDALDDARHHRPLPRARASSTSTCTSRVAMLTPGGYAEAVLPARHHHDLLRPPRARQRGRGRRRPLRRRRQPRASRSASSCRHRRACRRIPGLELSGADLHGPEVETMLSWPEVGGLAEVMDMIGVLVARPPHGRRRRRRPRQRQARERPRRRAHRPELQAYLRAGIDERPRDLHRAATSWRSCARA